MTILRHECRQGRTPFIIWTAAICFFIATCIFIFPDMKGEMDGMSEMFASMGGFTAAFGMDKISFGSLEGFYAIECGSILGIGGGFYAAYCGILALSKEEKEHTAEFLLTQPVSRSRIITAKLLAVILQLVLLNLIVFGVSVGSMWAVGESIPWKEIALLHTAYALMQFELAMLCFGISAFLSRGGVGIGLGLAAAMYFMNLIANITDKAEFLRYITPFGYTDGATIVSEGCLDGGLILLGMLYAALGIAAAYLWYGRKDIHS